MTVIAYRDGVMAADSGAWIAGAKHNFTRKLARGADGTLYGVTGRATEACLFLAWVDAGCQGAEPRACRTGADGEDSSFCILRVRPGFPPELVTAHGIEIYEGAPYMAIGGAQDAALGALHAGASAEAAVLASIAHSQWAHGPVRTISRE